MSGKILITPKSFKNFKSTTYPLMEGKGYEIEENTSGRTMTADELLQAVMLLELL